MTMEVSSNSDNLNINAEDEQISNQQASETSQSTLSFKDDNLNINSEEQQISNPEAAEISQSILPLEDDISDTKHDNMKKLDTVNETNDHLASSSDSVANEIMSELFNFVCEEIDNRKSNFNKVEEAFDNETTIHSLNKSIPEQMEVDKSVDDEVTSNEIVSEIISDIFYSVCERIENKLNEQFIKGPKLGTLELELKTKTIDAIKLVENCTLVPYEDSSESNSEDSESDSASSNNESDSSSSTSSTSSSDEIDSDNDINDEIIGNNTGQFGKPVFKLIKTHGELGLDDLPKIEHLQISAEGCKLRVIGNVHAIVDQLVVIRTRDGSPTLNIDSHLFMEDGSLLGQIFDVFGNTRNPFYSIRFNNREEIEERFIKIGNVVYYAPEKTDLYSTIFAEELKKCGKGSDASWEHNNEPPDEFLDFSDDESERLAKRKSKAKRTAMLNQNYFNKRKWEPSHSPNNYSGLWYPYNGPQIQPANPFLSTSNPIGPQFPSFPQYSTSPAVHSNSEGFGQINAFPQSFNYAFNAPLPPPSSTLRPSSSPE